MLLVRDFLKEVDRRWQRRAGEKIRLRIIGSAALVLQTGYERVTKDSDVLETESITEEIKVQLLQVGGEGSELHQRHKMYLDIVSRGLPLLPQSSWSGFVQPSMYSAAMPVQKICHGTSAT